MVKEDSMAKIQQAFEASGLTLDELGIRMGYSKETARKSAWQFINKTNDPRVSMIRKFAKAVNVPIKSLFDD